MKLVWVNRFNPDGSSKPMSEWQLRTTKHEDKFYFKDKYSDFDGFLEADCKFEAKDRMGPGYLIEYIGNQRGDGWFNVEDEQPPTDVPVLVLRDPQYAKVLTHDDVAIGTYWSYNEPSFGHTFELSEGGCWFLGRCDTLLWQPIEPPKHLD